MLVAPSARADADVSLSETYFAFAGEGALHEDGKLDTTALNAYAFGIGPRVGVMIPVMEHIYFGLAATGGVIGANRLAITAGFGLQTAPRPPLEGCSSDCR
jgi:hypothetical protein